MAWSFDNLHETNLQTTYKTFLMDVMVINDCVDTSLIFQAKTFLLDLLTLAVKKKPCLDINCDREHFTHGQLLRREHLVTSPGWKSYVAEALLCSFVWLFAFFDIFFKKKEQCHNIITSSL